MVRRMARAGDIGGKGGVRRRMRMLTDEEETSSAMARRMGAALPFATIPRNKGKVKKVTVSVNL